MKSWKGIAGAFAIAALCGCMQNPQTTADTASDVPAARVMGAAQSCISIAQIQQTLVRDDRTIDFRAGANRWYRNTLPYRCPGLGFERAFSYQTSLSQLCNTDIIHVLGRTGGGVENRAACGLGQFVPVELIR